MKTFTIYDSAHPCTELVLDISQIRTYMQQAGYQEVTEDMADIVFVTTCAFNMEYEEDAVRTIKSLRSGLKTDCRLIVTGCLPPINPERIKELGDVETLPPREMNLLEEWFPSQKNLEESRSHLVRPEAYHNNPLFMKGIRLKTFLGKISKLVPIKPPLWLDTVPMPDWYFVRGGTGCAGNCSYCAIRRSRGHIRSYSLESIKQQVEKGVKAGYREISLAGDDMGCWGVDIDLTLADLLQVLVAIPGQFSINLRFIEPLWLLRNLEKLLPIFQSGKIHSFCVPIQSASQSVLTAMNRNYRISDVVAACNHIMQDTKVSSISSIIMVGFPGETTQDFAKSYSLLERCDIPLYQVLKYEGRPDTPSEQMPDKVSDEIKELRQQRFMKKMKLMKFVGLSAKLAEKIVTKKFGPLK